jgi:V-type H+-transporting ATPase subunit C
LKTNFSEAFIHWIHTKALRVFVETVLRYGLPLNFQAVVIQPQKRNNRKLRETLNQLYEKLDTSSEICSKKDVSSFQMLAILKIYSFLII